MQRNYNTNNNYKSNVEESHYSVLKITIGIGISMILVNGETHSSVGWNRRSRNIPNMAN